MCVIIRMWTGQGAIYCTKEPETQNLLRQESTHKYENNIKDSLEQF